MSACNDLRHFAATQLLAAGVRVRTVAGHLAHANAAATLNVYAHVVQFSDEEPLDRFMDGQWRVVFRHGDPMAEDLLPPINASSQ